MKKGDLIVFRWTKETSYSPEETATGYVKYTFNNPDGNKVAKVVVIQGAKEGKPVNPYIPDRRIIEVMGR